MNLGPVIRHIRKQRNLSQTDLAAQSGLTQTALSHIERGATRPSSSSLEALCKTLQVPQALLYMLSLTEEEVPPGKRPLYRALFPALRDFALEVIDITP